MRAFFRQLRRASDSWNPLRLAAAILQGSLEEVRRLKTPALPVGVFLTATLCLVVWRDRGLSLAVKPLLDPLSALLHVGTDSLYCLIALFLAPLAFLLLARESPARYGLTLGKVKLALPVFAVFLFGFGMVAFLSGRLESIAAYYGGSPRTARESSLLFLQYLISLWGWEFINRGFLLLGLKRHIGVYAVYVQLIPFVILHLGKPPFELYGSILFGLLFGYYAYLVDSFIYCAFVHAWFALVMDLSIGFG
jgi:hypothetical protein